MVDVVDGMIGRKFGKYQQVEVIDRGLPVSKSHARNYTVHCSECAKDPELFGDGNFTTQKGSLVRGRIPCGCAKTPRWSKQQYEVRVKRECDKRDYTFLGFSGEWLGVKTMLEIQCNKDGFIWNSTNIDSFMRKESGCLQCSKIEKIVTSTKPDVDMISNFMATGKFAQGTEFWRSPVRRDSKGKPAYWMYKCPICSEDEFTKSGLCTGIFEGFSGTLQRGQLPCRCSKTFPWTKDQQEYRIKNLMLSEDSGLSFVEWSDEYVNVNSEFIAHCAEHGNFPTSPSRFLNNGTRCPSCAVTGYDKSKTGFVYVLAIDGDTQFTGYGISGQPKDRLTVHKTNLAKFGLSIVDAKVFETTGSHAFNIESLLKKTFKLYPQDVSGFKTEATHANLFNDVVKFVEINIAESNMQAHNDNISVFA